MAAVDFVIFHVANGTVALSVWPTEIAISQRNMSMEDYLIRCFHYTSYIR